MPLADSVTRGVNPATFNGHAIPEIRVAPAIALSVTDDIHFGINLSRRSFAALYADLDMSDDMEADLIDMGPRTIDIKRRGGRTAEDDWFIEGGRARARPQTDMTQAAFDTFNQPLPIKSRTYPVGAQESGVDKAGQAKGYHVGATNKSESGGLQMGKRWSKTALESALSRGGGRIHFHLTGMGDLAGPLGKTGHYGFNVTSHELRYVKRFWNRFQEKVTFYNGYTSALAPVIVEPPWLSAWQPNTPNCGVCNEPFSRAFPLRWPHHCRLCGLCVCDDCSPHRVRLKFPAQEQAGPRKTDSYRVCTTCYGPFTRGAPSHF
jgi:hypothetical protein